MSDSMDVKERVEPISLLQHSVRVSDPYLLQFFYPDFRIVNSMEEYQANMDNIIYTGNYKLVMRLKQANIKFIATNVPTYDYDLTDQEELIRFVFAKHKKNPPKYLIDTNIISSMSYDECVTYCKMVWVSGQWFGPKIETASNSFEFIQSMRRDAFYTVLKNYYELDFDITKYLLAFLSNVLSRGDSKDGRYKELLVFMSSTYGNRVKPAVNNYLRCNVTDLQLRTFYLLFDLLCPIN